MLIDASKLEINTETLLANSPQYFLQVVGTKDSSKLIASDSVSLVSNALESIKQGYLISLILDRFQRIPLLL